MAVVIRRLEEHDHVENFDCGEDALNNYLKRHAWTNQQKISIGVSYVALEERRSANGARLLYSGDGKRASRSVSEEVYSRSASLRSAADFTGAARRGSAIRRPGLGHALISEALRISVRAAEGGLSRRHRGRLSEIGSVGIHVMVLCPLRVLQRRDQKDVYGDVWTRTVRADYSALKVTSPTDHKSDVASFH